MEKLINIYLTANFGQLCEISGQFIDKKLEDYSAIDGNDLEKVGKEFLKTYKTKTDAMLKEIRNNVAKSKQDTRKELVQRLVRIIMLNFSTYIEIVKNGQFGANNAFLKGIATNTSQNNQVLLDLKNCSMY
jgi:hypothetical protein